MHSKMSAFAGRIFNRIMAIRVVQIAKGQAEFYSKAAGEFRALFLKTS